MFSNEGQQLAAHFQRAQGFGVSEDGCGVPPDVIVEAHAWRSHETWLVWGQ